MTEEGVKAVPDIHMLTLGPFGRQVNRRFRELYPETTWTDLKDEQPWLRPDQLPLADVYILASWRPEIPMENLLDGLAHAWKRPWVPVTYEHPFVRIGPVIIPGESACCGCFRRRQAQHSPMASLDDVLYSHYEKNPEAGPAGHPPSIARFAAAAAAQVIDALSAGEPVAGTARVISTYNLQTTLQTVSGVHGCKLCGLKRDEGTRSYALLAGEIQKIIAEGAGE